MSSAPKPNSFHVLLSTLGRREDRAWAEVYERYAARLIGLARRRLHPRLRPKVGASDVVQSVFKALLIKDLQTGRRPRNWDELWGLLARMAVFRCSNAYRGFVTAKRNFLLEVPVVTVPEEALGERNPDPEEAAAIYEAVERSLEPCDEREREIVRHGLLGYDDAEISEQVGCTEYEAGQVFTVYARRLEQVVRAGEAVA